MNSYFSTFIVGFNEVVAGELTKRLLNVKVLLLTDGLITYETTSLPEEIKKLKFINNSFILVKKFDNVKEDSVNEMLRSLLRDRVLENAVKQPFFKQNLKFRVRASVKNQFVAIDKSVLRSLEEKITKTARNLKVDRSLPDIEFLATVRSEGFGLVGIQFTHRTNYEKVLEKGELYPELAHILCLISEPRKEDVFLDPFAGHGSIPFQRASYFPSTKVMAGDADNLLVGKLQKKLGKMPGVKVNKLDALDLNNLEESSVDKIVTDPPWGLHEGKDLDLPDFYRKMLKELYRVTKSGGIIVILTAQKEIVETQIDKISDRLELTAEYHTLVSGQKAGVYKLIK